MLMGVIVAVLRDLYRFAFVYGFGFLDSSLEKINERDIEATPKVSNSGREGTFEQASLPAERPEQRILVQTDTSRPLLQPVAPGVSLDAVGYVFVPEAPLYNLPTRSFDGVVARLSYGASLQILNRQGSWYSVLWNDIRGWIAVDAVTESKVELDPQFVAEVLYSAEDPNTIKLRTRIDDAFHAGALILPLTDVEYVYFKLIQKGRVINWPPERPRLAGVWQRILKGVVGVHIGVHPKTGAVMEYVHDDETGHVAYVESVFPDGSILISEVGCNAEGEYGERTLTPSEWREFRPVFIDAA